MRDVLEQMSKSGCLRLDTLDEILSDDAAFSENVRKLVKHLNGTIRVEIPGRDAMKGVRIGGGIPRGKHKDGLGMTREEEQRVAKRMEFFRHRLLEGAERTGGHAMEDQGMKRFCSMDAHALESRPACEESGCCPVGREGTAVSFCLAYRRCRNA